jgi:putative hydrolase of HD superfamily
VRPDALRARLLEVLALKALPRAGWVRVGVPAPESVAAHSWGVAWLVLALCPPGLDRGRALAIAVLHDLAEVRVGDLTPADRVDPAEKSRAEALAMAGLLSGLRGAAELLALWREYEDASTPEGRLVKACDKLDMALQAARYSEETGLDLAEFIDSALARLEDPLLRALAGG